MRTSTTLLSRLCLLTLVSLVTACGTLHKEATGLGDASNNKVIVIGRIELVPPLRQNEQNIKLGTFDPFDAKGAYLGRAVLHLAQEPMAREKTNEVFNPRLEETFFYSIPKDKRYVVDAGVMMYAHARMVSRRQMSMDTGGTADAGSAGTGHQADRHGDLYRHDTIASG